MNKPAPKYYGLYALLCVAVTFPTAHAATAVSDIDYNGTAEYADDKDKLDLYVPANATNAPVVLFIHGGGLVGGSKDGARGVGQTLAQAGFVTACTNYRLSPGVAHPAHIEDVATAFAWLHEHAPEHGGDPNKMFVVGHSAGAYLAALLATDVQYLSKHGLSLADIRGAVPISGFFHVDRIAPGRSKSIWGETETTWASASPANHAGKAAPPILLLYADGDDADRKKESQDFTEKLTATGSTASYAEIADRTHVTLVTKFRSNSDDTSARTIAFIQECLQLEN